MRTLHGLHVHGFPNAFVVGLAQGANLVSNVTHNLVEAATTIAGIISRALETGADEVEVTPEAEAAWVALLQSSERGFLGNPDCTPGYYNNEGRTIEAKDRLGMSGYPDGPLAYFDYIDAWRRTGTFEGLVFRTRA